MTTRRKAGSVRKKQAAPRKKAAVSRVRASATGRRASSTKRASAGGSAVLAAFPADCTIAQAADMKARLARVLAQPACVTLDLSGIRRVDTAALQVLTAFIHERRAAGRDVQCRGTGDAFLHTAEVLGLSALFRPVTDDRLAAPATGSA